MKLKGSPWSFFFGTLTLFCHFFSSECQAFRFLVFCSKLDVKKTQSSHFRFLALWDCFKILIFLSEFDFLEIHPSKNFPTLSEFFALYPNFIVFHQGGSGISKTSASGVHLLLLVDKPKWKIGTKRRFSRKKTSMPGACASAPPVQPFKNHFEIHDRVLQNAL